MYELSMLAVNGWEVATYFDEEFVVEISRKGWFYTGRSPVSVLEALKDLIGEVPDSVKMEIYPLSKVEKWLA